jgi:LmbE family N-acetylglucosaminyl deacetylase
MHNNPVLMVVIAHPDDETFGMGGTLAYYASIDVEIFLVCATRGEAGEVQDKYLQRYNSIAALRIAELECAAKQLGIKKLIFLDYLDSGMPGSFHGHHPQALVNAHSEKLVIDIVRLIREIRPDVIITHDPMGGYMHPDHIKLHRAVKDAFFLAGDPNCDQTNLPEYSPQKLYYNSISRSILRWIVRLMPLIGKDPSRFGQNGDIDLRSIARAELPIHARINYTKVKNKRMAASNCHASQGGQNMNKGVAGLLRGWNASHEVFMKGFPEPVAGYVENDLFEGL